MARTITEYLLKEFKCLTKEEIENLNEDKKILYKNVLKYDKNCSENKVSKPTRDYKKYSKRYYNKNKNEINKRKRERYYNKKLTKKTAK